MILDTQKMTIEEKMQAMELLWDDICSGAPGFQSPNWHETILEEREQRLREGKEKFVSWEEAKKELQGLIS